jgi:uncharacterized membrane protein YhhN
MDFIIFLLIIISFLVIVTTSMYIKFVTYDENNYIAYFIKWIPVFFLCIQTTIMACYYKCKHNDKYLHRYCLFLIIAYIFCIMGDILLVFNTNIMFMVGMLMFMFSYGLFGLGRIYNIKSYISYVDKFKIVSGIVIITIVQLCYVPYVVMEALPNENFNGIPLITAICIYSCFINFGVTSNYIYLVSFGTLRAWFSFIGVLMFGVSDCILIIHDIKYPYKYLETLNLILYWGGLTIVCWSTYYSEKIGHIILNGVNDHTNQ